MLTLVSLFLATFLVAALVIWLYRMFFGVQNYDSKAISKKRSRSSMKLGAQQGYVSLARKSQKGSRSANGAKVKAKPGLRVASGGNKVPWGW